MAANNAFDSPDSVQLKGKVGGITRISKKVRALAALIVVGLLGYAMYMIFGANDDSAAPVTQAATDAKQVEQTATPATPDFRGVGAGVVVPAAAAAPAGGTPAFVVGGPPAAGVGAASGPLVTAAVGGTPVVPNLRGGGVQPGGGGGEYKSPAQIRAEQQQNALDERRQQAIMGDLDGGGGAAGAEGLAGAVAGAGNSATNPMLAALAQAASAAAAAEGAGGAGGMVPAIGGGAGQQDDQNKQVQKSQFLATAGATAKTILPEVKMPPNSPYEIKAGWAIPAALECGLNSDLPGQTCARVTENVYDTATGRFLLVPQGTKLIGTYDSQVAYGQERILVVWNRLIYPDGSSISLDGMPGEDKGGYAGFDADVNNHYIKVLGAATMMALFTAGIELSQKQSTNVNGVQTNSQVISQSVGQQLGQTGSAYIQKGMNIQPTLTRDPGYQFNVIATRDIIFPSTYRSHPANP
jgi:type IV secretory pathway VirB10-like protein